MRSLMASKSEAGNMRVRQMLTQPAAGGFSLPANETSRKKSCGSPTVPVAIEPLAGGYQPTLPSSRINPQQAAGRPVALSP